MINKFTYTITALLLFLLLFSCSTVPQGVDQSWSEAMFFKQAQEAVDDDHLEEALFYYEVFLVRFPESHGRVIAAEYERAILHKKLGAEDLAIQELKLILDKFENSPYVSTFQPRYKLLAQKVLDIMKGRPVEEVDPDKYPARQTASPDGRGERR